MEDLGLPDHGLAFCTQKTLRPNSYKDNEIFVRQKKHYTTENFKKHQRIITSAIQIKDKVYSGYEKRPGWHTD